MKDGKNRKVGSGILLLLFVIGSMSAFAVNPQTQDALSNFQLASMAQGPSEIPGIPPELIRLNGTIFNQYVENLIIQSKALLKQKLKEDIETKQVTLTECTINNANFDINTGAIAFTIHIDLRYRNGALKSSAQTTTAINAQLLLSSDSKQVGLYVKSAKFTIKFGVAWPINSVKITFTTEDSLVWQDGKDHSNYYVFTNDNLKSLANALIQGAFNEGQANVYKTELAGAVVMISLSDPRCQIFDINAGLFKLSTNFDLAVQLTSGESYKFTNVGSIALTCELYSHRADQNWWIHPTDFKLEFSILDESINKLLSEVIYGEMNKRYNFVHLELPGSSETYAPISSPVPTDRKSVV